LLEARQLFWTTLAPQAPAADRATPGTPRFAKSDLIRPAQGFRPPIAEGDRGDRKRKTARVSKDGKEANVNIAAAKGDTKSRGRKGAGTDER
jgi:hypothetical protein